MAKRFANILAAMGLGSDTEPVTEAHLQAANDKIAQLEADKATADADLATARATLATTQATLDTTAAELKTTQADLTTVTGKVATLEEWKKNNKAGDARQEDASNDLDRADDEPQAGFEREAAAQVARAKARLGVK